MRIKNKNINLIKKNTRCIQQRINKIKLKSHLDELKKLKRSCYLALFTSKNKKEH